MKGFFLSIAFSVIFVSSLSAHDFMATINGQKIYFNVTDSKKLTVEVTYGGSIMNKNSIKPQGQIEIPAKVKHNGKVYSITAIGQKAFANATELKTIVLPIGIKEIKDFAFENCSKLNSIIMPGAQVKFGQGTFFLCSNIEAVTFGSDWTQIDLAIFRWSDKIQEIYIPAKVDKIYNLNTLKGLKKAMVDSNNSKYSSCDGIVYSKDFKVLLACPLAYEGLVKVAENTSIIRAGAMIGCVGITSIELPETMEKFSFREFSKMSQLQTINIRNSIPAKTARYRDGEVFILQLANQKAKVNVPKSALKEYKNKIVVTEGEFYENSSNATTPYLVKSAEMATAKNLYGVRIFK